MIWFKQKRVIGLDFRIQFVRTSAEIGRTCLSMPAFGRSFFRIGRYRSCITTDRISVFSDGNFLSGCLAQQSRLGFRPLSGARESVILNDPVSVSYQMVQ